MRSFKEYITEMFDTSAQEVPHYHPDYKFVPAGEHTLDTHVYRGHIKDSDKEYRIGFMAKKLEDGVSKIAFTVNNRFYGPSTPIPAHHALAIGKKIHEYFHHHMMTQKPRDIVYDTDDPVRHSIYQAMAGRYGITATNISGLTDRKRSRRR